MRAAFYEMLGPARDVLQLGDMPDPQPGAGEVRVRMATSGVNPSDVKMRLGTGSASNQYPRIIPHSDGAGVIDLVGDGVSKSRLGKRVWLWNARWNRAFGTAAEFITLPTEQAIDLPDNIDFTAGACLGIPALTAWQAVETDGGVESGQWVLVNGGAGAVGHYAVQMAALKGARVIATVSSQKKADHAKIAGAEIIIDRKKDDIVASIKSVTRGKGVARAIEVDFSGNIGWLPLVMADYGLITIYGSSQREAPISFGPSILANIGYRFFIVYSQPQALRERALKNLTNMLGAGFLKHSIAATLPLDKIVMAHEMVEQGSVIGNVVINL